MLELHTGYLSETGGRLRNEDACGYWSSEGAGCWIVSDGAGGHGSGDIASRLVVTTVLQRFQTAPQVSHESAAMLLQAAQNAVMQEKFGAGQRNDMHATAAILLIDVRQQLAVWGHVGDSRIYWFRSGQLVRRTRDHSLVQQMMDVGLAGGDATREHPKRSILTSAIGAAGELSAAVTEPLRLQAGDSFLICSDGWWEHVLDDEMQAPGPETPERWLERMAGLIRARAPSGNDNYTAIAVEVNEADETTILVYP